jgi:hypothetical protein
MVPALDDDARGERRGRLFARVDKHHQRLSWLGRSVDARRQGTRARATIAVHCSAVRVSAASATF